MNNSMERLSFFRESFSHSQLSKENNFVIKNFPWLAFNRE
jgi:hypothetical protein